MCVRCDNNQSLEQTADHILGVIAEHGWAMQGVTDGGHVMFLYTIGMTQHGHPELLIPDRATFADTMNPEAALTVLARRQLRTGPFTDGQVTQALRTTVRLRAVHNGDLGMARMIYGAENVTALAITLA